MKRRALLLAAPLAVALVASCADLQPLDAGTCGNKVVDANEQCDTFGVGGTTACRAGDCKFDCSGDYTCPKGRGYGCDYGSGACAQPAGTFRQSATTFAADVTQLAVADFDGDHRADVLSQGPSGSAVHFFEASGALANPTNVPIGGGRIVTGSLTGDGLASLTVVDPALKLDLATKTIGSPVGGTLNVWRSRSDRTILPTIYPSFPIPVMDGSALVVTGVAGGVVGDDIFVIFDTLMVPGFKGALAYIYSGQKGTETIEVTPLDATVADFAGAMPVAIQFPSEGCDRMVLAPRGAKGAAVFPLCKANAAGAAVPNVPPTVLGAPTPYDGPQVLPLIVALPPGATVDGGAFFVDAVDSTGKVAAPDGVRDLLIAATLGTDHLFVAPGTALLKDQSDYVLSDKFVAFPWPKVLARPTAAPLAVGMLDGDDVLDWVAADGVHFGDVPIAAPYVAAPSAWAEAAVIPTAIYNDVVARSASAVDYYKGTHSTLLNHLAYPLGGQATHLALGDFDGDLVLDVAVTVTGDADSLAAQAAGRPTSDALSILYGKIVGFPEAPIAAGRLPSIMEIEPGYLSWFFGTPDGVSGIAAISATPSTAPAPDGGTAPPTLYASAIEGSTLRQLTAPLQLALASDPSIKGAGLDVLVGHFTPSGKSPPPNPLGNDLVAWALDVATYTMTKKVQANLWYAAVSGDAVIDSANFAVSDPLTLDPAQLAFASLAAIDLDPPSDEPVDEIVLLAPASGCGAGKKFVAGTFATYAIKPGSGGGPATFASRQAPSASTTFNGCNPPARGVAALSIPLQVADFDGDGSSDLLVFSVDEGEKPVARVYLNDRSGQLATDPAHVIDLAVPPDTVDVAAVRAKTDGTTSIAILGATAVTLASLDLSTHAFVVAQSPAFTIGAVPVDIAAGDVNGDGVDDLVVATEGSIEVHLGDVLARSR